ncbi:allantoicase [Williamsia sp. M5A3_1d]
MPDLALRSLGGAVVTSTDALFAEAENLITPAASEYRPATFGHKGQIYDGWETRRRRPVPGDGVDRAIVRLGVPGVIHGVVVDTSWFVGNYPPTVSVEAAVVTGFPPAHEVVEAQWETIVERQPVAGDSANPIEVTSRDRFTHVRLSIYPDGGVARLRVHGRAVPDPQFLGPQFDLAALENGARISACSNMFYGSPNNLLMPGPARSMGEGWETSRRRDDGNDWVEIDLAAQGVVSLVELDTSWFLGNAPGEASVHGRDGADGEWFEILPRTPLQPDTRHRFVVDVDRPMTRARMDIHPDGGMARLRLSGSLTDAGRADLQRRWDHGDN